MIINLTQHIATPEQRKAGVFDPACKKVIQKLLTFDELPTKDEIEQRARKLATLAYLYNAKKAMIGGAPFLMASLEKALKERNITPVYAFSRREVIEESNGKKISVFKHLGFVEA